MSTLVHSRVKFGPCSCWMTPYVKCVFLARFWGNFWNLFTILWALCWFLKLWSCLNILPSALLDLVFSLIREKGFASTGGKKQKCSFTLHSDHCTAPRSQLLSSLTKIGVSEQFLSIQLWFFFKSLITSIRRCQLNDYVHALTFQYWKAVNFFWYMVFIRSLNSEAIFLSVSKFVNK